MECKPYKKWLWTCLFVAALVIILMTATTLVLPYYLQSTVIPNLAAEFNLEPVEVQVRRIGWWGADLGPVRFDARQAPALSFAAIQIDYTPWSLLHGRIKGVTLGGVELVVQADSNGLNIAGQSLVEQNSTTTQETTIPDLETLLPVQLDYLRILQSQVLIEWQGRHYVLPLEGRIETAGLNQGLLQGRVELVILGNPIMVAAELDQQSNSIILKGEADHFLLAGLCRAGLLPGDLKLSGKLDLNGRAALQLDTFAFSGFEISGRLSETEAQTPWVRVKGLTGNSGEPQPIDFTIAADTPDHIRFNSTAMVFTGPLQAVMSPLQGQLSRGASGWFLEAQVETLLPEQTLSAGLIWQKELSLPWTIQATQNLQQGIEFNISSTGSQPVAAKMDPLRLSGETFQLELSGSYAEQVIKAKGTLNLGQLQLDSPDASVAVPALRINGSMTLPQLPEPSKATMKLSLTDVRSKLNSTQMILPEINISVEGQANPDAAWNFNGRLNVAGGQVQDKVSQVSTQGLSLKLPFIWPPVAKAQAGQLDSGTIQWKGHKVGNLTGTVQQAGRSLEVSLKHRSQMLAGLEVFLKGRLQEDGIQAEVDLPSYQTTQNVDLGRFIPEASGVMVAGRFAASSKIQFKDGSFQGKAQLKLDQGSLTIDEHDLHLNDIDMTLQIDDLVALKSAPQQRLSVTQLQVGDIIAENLEVDFQLENAQTLFLEKVGLEWCRGTINTAALRITTGKEDYEVVLFCDRLDLAIILEQLGIVEAGGHGTVNGKLPIRWLDGNLSFENGFLYSTPGQSGNIRMKGADTFLAGVPPGTPQHTQLDIATEALKDYNYQWARLSVESNDDILLLKLQMEGKPNRLLPFAYDQQLGQFQRIAGEGQADFKGIGIDLNIRSPLNEIIHYKELLKSR